MQKNVELLLRIGLAFAFLYPPVAAFFDPYSWLGFFPQFMRDIVGNDALLLHAFGVFELLIGLWLLSGKRIFIPSVLAAATLAGIVVFDLGAMDIIFRDVSILAIALALALNSHTRSSSGWLWRLQERLSYRTRSG